MTISRFVGCPFKFPIFVETMHAPMTDQIFSYPPCYHPTMFSSDILWFGSFHFHCCAMFSPVGIILTFNVSKPSRSTFLNHQTDWFQSQQFSQFCVLLPFF